MSYVCMYCLPYIPCRYPQRFFIVVAALQQIAIAVKPPNYIEKPKVPDKVCSFKFFFFFFNLLTRQRSLSWLSINKACFFFLHISRVRQRKQKYVPSNWMGKWVCAATYINIMWEMEIIKSGCSRKTCFLAALLSFIRRCTYDLFIHAPNMDSLSH